MKISLDRSGHLSSCFFKSLVSKPISLPSRIAFRNFACSLSKNLSKPFPLHSRITPPVFSSSLSQATRLYFSSKQPQFSFPSEELLLTYLENHPFTNDSYLKEQEILNMAAKFFSDSTKTADTLHSEVNIMLNNLNEAELHLSCHGCKKISNALIGALQDCANNSPLPNAPKDDQNPSFFFL